MTRLLLCLVLALGCGGAEPPEIAERAESALRHAPKKKPPPPSDAGSLDAGCDDAAPIDLAFSFGESCP